MNEPVLQSAHTVPPPPVHASSQDWAAYRAEEHDVWATLYGRRIAGLERDGSTVFHEGIDAIGLRASRIPDLREINRRLEPVTGWCAVAVGGFIPAGAFFSLLAARRFPTVTTIRPADRLDYVPEPDIFHDVFGHVPMHAHPVFASFLQRFGAAASRATSQEQTDRLARLFWFTVEFGLVRERGAIKVYGSGLISSAGDCAHALGDMCDRRRFDLEAVMNQPFEIDHYQDVLFVIDSFDELFDALEIVERRP